MSVLACFPAGRDDPANLGWFVLKLSRSGINHYLIRAVSVLNAANSLPTTSRIRGGRFLETGHSAVRGIINAVIACLACESRLTVLQQSASRVG